MIFTEGQEALPMEKKNINDQDYLFVEAGGFSGKHPEGWTCPVLVYKRNR